MSLHITSQLIALSLLALSLTSMAATPISEALVKSRTKGTLIYYSGTITLTGTVDWRTDDETLDLIGDHVCFVPAGSSAKLIPREKSDSRSPWFCFSNQAMAMKSLGIPASKPNGACGYAIEATLVVTDYIANREESEVFDIARLVAVKSSGPLRLQSCAQH